MMMISGSPRQALQLLTCAIDPDEWDAHQFKTVPQGLRLRKANHLLSYEHHRLCLFSEKL